MKNYVVIDFETTGLHYLEEQIIEVALIKYDHKFTEIGSYNTFVQLNNGRELPSFITDLTGITEKDLGNGVPEVTAFETINTFIDEDTVVVAQYAPFDLSFLYKHGIVPSKYICTKSLTSQVEPDKSSSLVPTCDRLGISLEDAHRAFADVKATAELLQYRLKEGKAKYIENYIVKSPDRQLVFTPIYTKKVLEKEQFKNEPSVRKVKLIKGFKFYNEQGEEELSFDKGNEYEVLHEFESNTFKSGKGLVIFDGIESVTVDSNLVVEVE